MVLEFKFLNKKQFSKILILFILNLIQRSNSCSNFCRTNSTCVGSVGDAMSLVCEDMMIWYKTPDKKLGTSTTDITDTENYSINNCVVTTSPSNLTTSTKPIRQQVLTIKSLGSKDSGYNSYKARVDYEDDENYCYYNIFVYGKYIIK